MLPETKLPGVDPNENDFWTPSCTPESEFKMISMDTKTGESVPWTTGAH